MALETTPKFGVLVVPATCLWLPSRRPSIRWLRRPMGKIIATKDEDAWGNDGMRGLVLPPELMHMLATCSIIFLTGHAQFPRPLIGMHSHFSAYIPHRCCLFLGLLPAEWGGWCIVYTSFPDVLAASALDVWSLRRGIFLCHFLIATDPTESLHLLFGVLTVAHINVQSIF
jgi:hypothetical protein